MRRLTKVMQTRFHKPPGELGNCYAACLATLLELPIEEVPQPSGGLDFDRGEFTREVGLWLGELGLQTIHLPCTDKETKVWFSSNVLEAADVFIACGPTVRASDVNHCVLMSAPDKLIHDPFPDGNGLTEVRWLEVLAPLRMWEWVRRDAPWRPTRF